MMLLKSLSICSKKIQIEHVSILASFLTKSLECVKMLAYKGFRYSEEFQKILSTSQKISGSLSSVPTIEPSRLDAHLTTVPNVRTTYHTIRTPFRSSVIRPDDVPYRPNASQTKHHSSGRRAFPSGPSTVLRGFYPAYIRLDNSAARPDTYQ
jgi:hypothetical protein